MSNFQKGFTPVLIIILIALVISGYLIYNNFLSNQIETNIPQQTVISSDLESPEQILQSLEKKLLVSSPIADQKSKNWVDANKQIVPLKGKFFGIGTFKNDYMDKYGNFPSLPDGNSDLLKITISSLEPLRKQVDSFFINKGFTIDSLNTKEITGFKNLYGYSLGDIHCLMSLYPQSDPFGQFFCGVLDPVELSWRKELVPVINPTNNPNTLVSVGNLIGNYATGGVGGYGSGAMWIAVKANGKWQKILTTQNTPDCSLMDKYFVPKEIYKNCIDKNGSIRQ